MGHARILARLWRRLDAARSRHLVDVGAGDGTLCLKMLSSLPPTARPERVWLLDRLPLISGATRLGFERLGCAVEFVQGDVFHWLKASPKVDAIMANLVLHHFEPEELTYLLRGMAACSGAVLAVEPRRSRLSLAASRLLGWIGCNAITRHDAEISVRAGFAGDELSRAWTESRGWRLEERGSGLFSHSFFAVRD